MAPDVDVDDAALASVCDRCGIPELKILGSGARGTATPGSDIDILCTLLPVRKLGWEIEQFAHEVVGILAVTSTLSPCAPCSPGSGLPRRPVCSVASCFIGEMIQAADRA